MNRVLKGSRQSFNQPLNDHDWGRIKTKVLTPRTSESGTLKRQKFYIRVRFEKTQCNGNKDLVQLILGVYKETYIASTVLSPEARDYDNSKCLSFKKQLKCDKFYLAHNSSLESVHHCRRSKVAGSGMSQSHPVHRQQQRALN